MSYYPPTPEETKKKLIELYMTEENNSLNAISKKLNIRPSVSQKVLERAQYNGLITKEWRQRMREYCERNGCL